MAWQFQTVFVEVSGGTSVSDQNHPFPGVANFGRPDKIVEVRRAECALKSFHIGYKQSDHNFKYQRIAIRDVRIAGSGVRFNVETSLKDDTDDANPYLGEVEVLVIADVYPDPQFMAEIIFAGVGNATVMEGPALPNAHFPRNR